MAGTLVVGDDISLEKTRLTSTGDEEVADDNRGSITQAAGSGAPEPMKFAVFEPEMVFNTLSLTLVTVKI
ncbi:MAG: hypothetical protein DDT19_02218 [Syntrophomonadaceae bacterium]|nr:hypothetical protein [Bacillota bacterium]